MKVLITGGHFSPAYSLIKELKKRGHNIAIAGRKYPFEDDLSKSLEYKISKEEGLAFFEVKTGRFQRKFTAYTISSLLRTPAGFTAAIRILLRARPDVILTFGGYIGLPISLAGRFLNIPVVLHEQTQKAGLANRIISKFANRVCVSFKSSEKYFSDRSVLTGNPLRKEIFQPGKKITIPKGTAIYITGGSTGSHFINTLVYDNLEDLLEKFVVIHQTGDSLKFRDHERLLEKQKLLPKELRDRYVLQKFIFPEQIGDVFKRAELIISRSGANIIFEIMATKKMSLLIPLPHGQNQEQLDNAKFIKTQGIGEYIEEADLNSDNFPQVINEMFENQQIYEKNMNNVNEFIKRDAAERIADIAEEVYGKKSS